MIAPADPAEAPPANGTPRKGSVTGPGAPPTYGPVVTGGDWYGAPGGCAGNPLGFAGWLNPHAYSAGIGYGYHVYRMVLRHPMVRAVRERVFGTICSSTWAVEVDKGVAKADDVKAFVGRRLGAVRDESMPDLLRCLDYGSSRFEVVWGQDDDGYYFPTLKYLWPEFAPIYQDEAGEFTGFAASLRPDLPEAAKAYAARVAGPKGLPAPTLRADAFKALLISYDGEGNLYGRSQLENLRDTAWIPWLLCAQQIAEIGRKISGVQAYGVAPVEQLPDGTWAADQLMAGFKALAQGKNFVAPGYYVRQETGDGSPPKMLPAVDIKVVDFGSTAPAIEGLLAQMGHYETLMWHGYLQSPRSGMESANGSRADAEQHTSNDTLFCERLANFITRRLQSLVDETCRLNWGLKPNQCRIVQPPIEDRLLAFKQQFYTSLAQNTVGAPVILRGIGLTELQGQLQIPANKSLKPGDLENLVVQQQDQARQDKLATAKMVADAKAAAPANPNNPAAPEQPKGEPAAAK